MAMRRAEQQPMTAKHCTVVSTIPQMDVRQCIRQEYIGTETLEARGSGNNQQSSNEQESSKRRPGPSRSAPSESHVNLPAYSSQPLSDRNGSSMDPKRYPSPAPTAGHDIVGAFQHLPVHPAIHATTR